MPLPVIPILLVGGLILASMGGNKNIPGTQEPKKSPFEYTLPDGSKRIYDPSKVQQETKAIIAKETDPKTLYEYAYQCWQTNLFDDAFLLLSVCNIYRTQRGWSTELPWPPLATYPTGS